MSGPGCAVWWRHMSVWWHLSARGSTNCVNCLLSAASSHTCPILSHAASCFYIHTAIGRSQKRHLPLRHGWLVQYSYSSYSFYTTNYKLRVECVSVSHRVTKVWASKHKVVRALHASAQVNTSNCSYVKDSQQFLNFAPKIIWLNNSAFVFCQASSQCTRH